MLMPLNDPTDLCASLQGGFSSFKNQQLVQYEKTVKNSWECEGITLSWSFCCSCVANLISQGSILGVEVNVSRKSYSTQLVVMEDENGNQNSAPPQNEGFLIPNIFTLTIPKVNE